MSWSRLDLGAGVIVAPGLDLIWDQISVESSGGLNPLVIKGLPKGQARHFVESVRERLNEIGAIPLQR